MLNVLLISDNLFIIRAVEHTLQSAAQDINLTVRCSKSTKDLSFSTINVKNDVTWIIENFDVVISGHCKQLFPAQLVNGTRCINIHPGLNPHNRGWFPQVFSILNGKPLGATIHVIDEELDHGPILAQQEVPLFSWDTSLSAYQRVQEAEKKLIEDCLVDILFNRCGSSRAGAGNVNLKRDFNTLCELDLEEVLTMKEAIDRLRALSHPPYSNAYFKAKEDQRKVYVSLSLEPENRH